MPTTMMEMMLTLDPVMYIMKPCIASVLAGDCAIPRAICDGVVFGGGSGEEGALIGKEEGGGAALLTAWVVGLSDRAAVQNNPPRSTQPNQTGT